MRTLQVSRQQDDSLRLLYEDGFELVSTCCGEQPGATATELLAAALGCCIAASLDPLLERRGHGPAALQISGDVSELTVEIELPAGVDEALASACLRAAEHCPVQRALARPARLKLAHPFPDRA